MRSLKVLIACEESQRVCEAFRKLGHEAYSCDILPCSGGHEDWHIQQDVIPIVNLTEAGCDFCTVDGIMHHIDKWDLIIAHPPCTYLTVTGNRWFNVEKYGEKALKRIEDRKEAIKFFMTFANANCDHVAIENPIGIMSTEWRKPDQYVQPFMFGDAFEKKTGLWLKGLPQLVADQLVTPEERVTFKSGKSLPKWYSDAANLPAAERSRIRSQTFPGFARAMAEQWSAYLLKND